MPAFLIAQVKVTNDSWIPEYAAKVHDIVHKHGGKYLSRSGSIHTIEGDSSDANLMAILQFPTKDKLMSFVEDPEYAPFRNARRAGTVSTFHVIDDTDAAGTIPYLPKAQ